MLTRAQKSLDFAQIKNHLKKYCLSLPGEERVEGIHPLAFEDLMAELSLLKAFYEEWEFRDFPSEPYPDIRPWVALSLKSDSVLDIPAFLEIRRFLEVSEKIRDFFIQSSHELLKQKGGETASGQFLIQRISEILDSEGQVKDSASPALREIREKMRVIRTQVESKLKSLLLHPASAHFFQEPVITVKDQRWVLPLKADFKGRVKGLVIDVSNTGETLFIEPQMVVEENNRFAQLKAEERSEILRILKNLTRSVENRSRELETAAEQAAHAEFLYARCCYGKALKASFPVMNQEGYYCLKKARHPLIDRPVPIDLELGREYRMLVITGPNTGGKTAALKTLGLLSLMASSGLMIPAEPESVIGYFDQLFTDIGDHQSITQSLSTFSGHMVYIRDMLQKVTARSLVLIDELGAGTDPKDGAALAAAILETLLDSGCRVVVTTHLESIKNMAFTLTGIQNASVEFDLQNLAPRYRLLSGVTGKSYALEIARRLGLKESVIERAAELLKNNQKEYNFEEAVERLNQEREKARQEKQKYSGLLEQLSRKWEDTLKKEKELRRIEEAIKKKETGFLLEEIKATRKQLIRLIEEAKTYHDLEKLREKARELEGLSGTARNLNQSITPPHQEKPFFNPDLKKGEGCVEFQTGDRVRIIALDQDAVVLSVQNDKQRLTALLGQMKMKVGFHEVQKLEDIPSQASSIEVRVNVDTGSVPFQLNLLGMRRDEALRETERYVHQLSLKGNEPGGVVVHGRGTGILKQAVAEFLKECPLVKEFKVSIDGGATHFTLKS